MNLEELEAVYPKGKSLLVTISRVENFGAFVELPGGIQGYIPTKVLSWTGSIIDAREKLRVGDKARVAVKKINPKYNSLILSLKEAQNDPWPIFCSTYKPDDTIKGRVIQVLEKSAYLELEGQVNGFLPLSHAWLKAEKMDEAVLVGDNLQAKIDSLNNEHRLVILSVAHLYEEEHDEQKISAQWSLSEKFGDLLDLLRFRADKSSEKARAFDAALLQKIRNILVVISETTVRLSTSMMLEELGFEADYVLNSETAISKFEENVYDLIILNITLQDGDAIGLAKGFLNTHPKPYLIIQTTLEEARRYLNKIMQAGIQNRLLYKPWVIEDLINLMNALVNGEVRTEGAPVANDSDFLEIISKSFISSHYDGIEVNEILAKIKRRTNAEFVIIFEQHLATLSTNIFASIGLEPELSEKQKEMLRFSPVKDVIHDAKSLHEWEIKNDKYVHLKPLGEFKAIIGERLDFKSDHGYGLFVFRNEPIAFDNNEVADIKIAVQVLGAAIKSQKLEEIYKLQHKLIVAGQLSSTLIHELKNEQQALFNYIEILKMDSDNLTNSKIKFNEIQFIARFQRIVRNLQDEQNKIQSIYYLFLDLLREKNEERIELSEHLTKLALLLRPMAKKSRIEIINPSNRIKPITINTSRLDQVITNLLINSLEQLPVVRKKTGKIWLYVYHQNDSDLPIKIEIKDNGPGIHEVQRERVFDIFFTTKKNGSGLGLFIAKALIESIGGKISIKETIRFGGTTFLIELPLNRANEG
ncbi:S1 RNA-binding domain-containing protein [candidate division KSB1 bacterium]|nr:S1 RNA-binding domain-containing protein [candidate division KSB1 bacterium]